MPLGGNSEAMEWWQRHDRGEETEEPRVTRERKEEKSMSGRKRLK